MVFSKIRKYKKVLSLLIVIIMVGLIAGGYYTYSRVANLLQSPESGANTALFLNTKCTYQDPDLCIFINNWKNIHTYAVRSRIQTKFGQISETLFEVEKDEKLHVLMTNNGEEAYNVITIGDTTYTKDYSDKSWWKQTAVDAEMKEPLTFDFNDADIVDSEKTVYKQLGKEDCGERVCFKYQIINPALADEKEYIWFDEVQYLIRKQQIEGLDGIITDTVFAYDNVVIAAPSPTKEAPADKVILPGVTDRRMTPEEKRQFEESMKMTKQQIQKEIESTGFIIPEDDNYSPNQ